jgi:hypothetical protein
MFICVFNCFYNTPCATSVANGEARKRECLFLEIFDEGILLDDLSLEVGDTSLELLILSLESLTRERGGLLLLGERSGGSGGLGNETRGHGAKLGLRGLTRRPLGGGQGGLLRGAVREEIILEDVRLAGNGERDGLNDGSLGLVQTHDFVGGNVNTALGESGHTSLGLGGGVGRQEVDGLVVINDLVVTDGTVTLTSQEQNVGGRVEEGHDDTGGSVDTLISDGILHVTGIPDCEATLSSLGETNREELAVIQPASTSTLDTLVGLALLSDRGRTGIKNTDLLILTEGGHERSIGVPINGLDDVGVTIDVELLVTGLDIPKLNLVVQGRGSEDVAGDGVKVNGTSLTSVARENLNGVSLILDEAALGDLPDLDSAILRGSSEDVVVEGGEGNIEDGALVSRE